MTHKYEIILYWSEADGAFVAEVPQLPGCMAHGDTQEAALDSVKQAMDLLDRHGERVRRPRAGAQGRTPDAGVTGDARWSAPNHSLTIQNGAREGSLITLRPAR